MKNFDNRICAVVVTYNRKKLLIQCLNSIKNQSKSIDTLLIVDNYSDDGTAEYLLEHGFINKVPPDNIEEPYTLKSELVISDLTSDKKIELIYVKMNNNTGGAGGFHYGQKKAFELGYEWLWLMDDDGFPSHNCLSILITKTKELKVKLVNPLVIDKDNKEFLSFGLSHNCTDVKSALKNSENGIILNKANPFNGTLLHRTLIEDIGFIKHEMFIWGDEKEYLKRANSSGYNFATVVSSLFYHPTSKTNYKEKCFGLLRIAKKPEKLEMNYYRNLGYLNRNYAKWTSHRVCIYNFLFYFLEGDMKKSFLTVLYYLDGFFNTYKLRNIR